MQIAMQNNKNYQNANRYISIVYPYIKKFWGGNRELGFTQKFFLAYEFNFCVDPKSLPTKAVTIRFFGMQVLADRYKSCTPKSLLHCKIKVSLLLVL